MPDLPPALYIPAFGALGVAIAWLAARSLSADSKRDEAVKQMDAIQDKWAAYQEKEIPLKIKQLDLTERLLDLLGGK